MTALNQIGSTQPVPGVKAMTDVTGSACSATLPNFAKVAA